MITLGMRVMRNQKRLQTGTVEAVGGEYAYVRWDDHTPGKHAVSRVKRTSLIPMDDVVTAYVHYGHAVGLSLHQWRILVRWWQYAGDTPVFPLNVFSPSEWRHTQRAIWHLAEEGWFIPEQDHSLQRTTQMTGRLTVNVEKLQEALPSTPLLQREPNACASTTSTYSSSHKY